MARAQIKLRVIFSQLAVGFLLTVLGPSVLGQSSHHIQATKPPEYTFEVIRVFPHDPAAFTQGLAYHDGFLYEGMGLNGHSSLRKVRLETGEIVQEVNLPPELFGEGITILKDQILQLTWTSQIGFVYNASDFRLLRQFSYSGEGWGLATDGHEIFMSDGSAEIRVLDAGTCGKAAA